jgi:hypothetical protein
VEDRKRDACLTKQKLYLYGTTDTVYILDAESSYLCTATKPDVATFVKFRNVLLKTGELNDILP